MEGEVTDSPVTIKYLYATMMHAENSAIPLARSLVNFPNFHGNMRIRVYDSQKPL